MNDLLQFKPKAAIDGHNVESLEIMLHRLSRIARDLEEQRAHANAFADRYDAMDPDGMKMVGVAARIDEELRRLAARTKALGADLVGLIVKLGDPAPKAEPKAPPALPGDQWKSEGGCCS